MKCPGGYCDRGFRNCCKDCDAYKTELCKEACTAAEVYTSPSNECIWAKDKEEETDRRMKKWVVILLIAVLAMLAFALWQTARNVTYIDKIKSGQSVAADPSALSSTKEDKSITNYSILDPGVLSND